MLLERTTEIALVDAALGAATEGRSSLVLLTGPSASAAPPFCSGCPAWPTTGTTSGC
ncbi:hypothetical protein ACFQVA_00840 [Actinomadura keratinilytica]